MSVAKLGHEAYMDGSKNLYDEVGSLSSGVHLYFENTDTPYRVWRRSMKISAKIGIMILFSVFLFGLCSCKHNLKPKELTGILINGTPKKAL